MLVFLVFYYICRMPVTSNSFQKGAYKTYNRKQIDSLAEYLDYIHYFQDLTKFESLWFRGVSKATHNLIPSIYRNSIWDYDPADAKNLATGFIHKAKGYIPPSTKFEKWEWYHIMQHYGLPTRLLDWTEGHLIALYFAVSKLSTVSTPCVWILNPFSLNEFSSSKGYIYFTDKTTMDDEDKIVDSYIDDLNPDLPRYPIAIEPAYTNERMTVQRSCFTIHGTVKNGFSSAHRLHANFELVQLKIRTSRAVKIKSQLMSAGITEATLFPDLEGLVRDLKFELDINNY